MLNTTNQTGVNPKGFSDTLIEGNRSLIIGSHRSSRAIDYSVSGNRLIEREDETIEIVPKHPAYVFGELVVRPALEATCRLTMQSWSLISSAASSFDNMITNLFNPFSFAAAQDIEWDYDELFSAYYSDSKTTLQFSRPLHEAVVNNDLFLVQQLVRDYGFNQRDGNNLTAIETSILENRQEIFGFLLDNGADIFSIRPGVDPDTKLSPIGLLLKIGRMDLFDHMVQHFPDSSRIFRHKTPEVGNLLHVAVRWGNAMTLSHLLTKHHSAVEGMINEQNGDGQTPLHLAASLNDVDSIFVLHDKRADLNARGSNNLTPLHLAAQAKHSEVVEFLIQLGANIDPLADGKRPCDLIVGDDPESVRTRTRITNYRAMGEIERLSRPDFSYSPPENLVFQGGGVKGFAYIGAIQALEDRNMVAGIKRIAGTSAGAITATFLSLGMSSQDINDMMKEQSWAEFLDVPIVEDVSSMLEEGGKILEEAWKFVKDQNTEHLSGTYGSGKKFAKSAMNLWSRLSDILNVRTPLGAAKAIGKQVWRFDGLCEGEKFRKWAEAQIKNMTGISHCTFGELKKLIREQPPGMHKFKDLYIYGTNIEDEPTTVCFNTEDPEWADVIISDALRISMSIPGVFKAHSPWIKNHLGKRVERTDFGCFVDGGLINNFPLETFDRRSFIDSDISGEIRNEPIYNRRTLGFNLFSAKGVKGDDNRGRLNGVYELLKGIVNVYFEAEQIIRSQITYNRHRVVKISDCNVWTLDLSLSDERFNSLTGSGRNATTAFFGEQGNGRSIKQNLYLYPRTFGTLPQYAHSTGRKPFFYNLEMIIKNPDHPTVLLDRGDKDAHEILIELVHKTAQIGSGFKIVFWIDGTTADSWERGVRKLARGLKLNDKEPNLNRLILTIRKKLGEEEYLQPWLLVVDRLDKKLTHEEKQMVLEGRGGKVVISAKTGAECCNQLLSEGLVALQEIPSMSEGEALSYVSNRLLDESSLDWERLVGYVKDENKERLTPNVLRRIIDIMSQRGLTINEFLVLSQLNWSGRRLDDAALKERLSLLINQHPPRLNLSNNNIGLEGIRTLFPYFKNLRLLDVSGNELGVDAFKELAGGVASSALEELKVGRIDHEVLPTLIRGMIGSKISNLSFELEEDVTKLNLSGLGLTHKELSAVLPSLCSSGVKEINLNDNHLQNKGLKVIANALSQWQITDLFLERNGITNHGVAALAEITPVHALEALHLSGNSISKKGVEVLAEMVSKGSVRHLSLHGDLNPVGSFDAKEWARVFGEVWIEPPLPANIEEILGAPCPFWKNKRVRDTHLLVLIPKSIDGQPYTLDLLEQLIQNPKGGGYKTSYRGYPDKTKKQLGGISVKESYWGLVTRDVILGSRPTTVAHLEAFLQEKGKGLTGLKARRPTALEAATGMLVEYVAKGVIPKGYTSCEDILKGDRIVVGGFQTNGFLISSEEGVLHDALCFWEL